MAPLPSATDFPPITLTHADGTVEELPHADDCPVHDGARCTCVITELRKVAAVAALKAWIESALAEGKTQAELMGELMRSLS